MPDELNQPQPTPSQPAPQATPQPAAPVSEPDMISVNRAEYDALQEQLQQAKATFDVLNPHAARIELLLKNSKNAELFDNAIAAYEQFGKNQGPQIDDSIRPVYEEVTKLRKFMDDELAHRQAEAERPAREAEEARNRWAGAPANERFFQRLRTDYPKLDQAEYMLLGEIAKRHGYEPLEATWKRDGWRVLDKQETAAAPPTSQRADAGEVGAPIPPANTQTPEETKAAMRRRIVELEAPRFGRTA